MKTFGTTIRGLRESQGKYLREVAAYLEMDTALLSKIERGERTANRQHVEKLIEYFKLPDCNLLSLWLGEKIYHQIEGEDNALDAIKVCEQRIKYGDK